MTETTKPVALLSFIRGAETSRGYDDFYSGSVIAPPKSPSEMTVREIQEWQRASVNAGSKSSAIGGYQIISKTFDDLVNKMGLTGDEVFTNDLQDQMGMTLLAGRGYNEWQAGKLDDQTFANNLSQEWAALPNHTGKSAYDGDGLNAATVTSSDLFGALNATRNGEMIDLSGIAPGAGKYNPSAAAAAAADASKQQRISQITAGQTSGGVDMTQVGSTPWNSFRTEAEDAAAEKASDENAPGFWEGAAIAKDEQWVASAMLRQLGAESFTPDSNFKFDENLWKEVTEGLPEDYHEVFGGAVSADHARALAATTRESFQRDLKMSQMGWTGIGLQFGAAILDPVSIGASLLTEGTAAPLIYGAKATKLARVLRGGIAAAAVNTAMDGYLISQDPVGEYSDLAYSAAAGFLLGGASGAFRKSPVDAEFRDNLKKVEARDGNLRDPAPRDPVDVTPRVNDGSIGAARVDGLQVDLSDAELAAQMAADTSKSFGGKLRIDIVGRLKQSENPIMRKLAGLIGEDAVGNADGSRTIFSAEEKAHRIVKQVETRYFRDHSLAYKAWAKEKGLRGRSMWDPAVVSEFNAEVGKAVRRPIDASGNAHVNKVAARVKTEYAELLKFGKEHNIKGFADLTVNDLYLTRKYNVQALDDVMVGAGRKGDVHRLFAEAFMSGVQKYRNANPARAMSTPELVYDDALEMASAYLKSIRSRKFQGFDLETAFSGQDMDLLREVLLDNIADTNKVDELLTKFEPLNDPGTPGMGITKRRMLLDEEYELEGYNLRVEDFLENDATDLFTSYANSVIRTGALEEALSAFKMVDPSGNVPTHAPSIDTIKRWITETSHDRVADDVDAEMRLLDVLYKGVKGVPMDPDTAWNRTLRRARGFNFVRVMGQLGVAQLSELGMILGNGGMKAMIKQMPRLRDFALHVKQGKVSDNLLHEIEAIWSMGTDVLRNAPASRMEDSTAISAIARGGKATKTQIFDYGLNQSKQAVATLSGMTHINRMLQRLNGRVLVQRFLDHAHGDRKINMRRFKALGIDEDMADRISLQIRDHMKFRQGLVGKKVTHIDIDQWTDVDAKNAFINGIDRWSRRSVQENSVGSMPAFMTKEMGKTIGQFRSFMLGAYTKQLVAGAQMRDWETFSSFMASMFFGGLFYYGQTYVNSVGRQDRDKWLEERLAPDAVAKAAFQRAGFSTFMPMLIDMGAAPFTDEPIFAYRTTDLSTGIWGNPTADLLNNGSRAIKGTLKAALNDDYDFSQQDARSIITLLPFQNAFGIRNMLALTTSGLPRFSQ